MRYKLLDTITVAFLLSVPFLAVILAVVFTLGEKMPVRLLRLFGIIFSSIPVAGIILGFFVREKAPNFAKACFIQAAYCGVGILLVY